jgi:hypothetical protein
LSESKLGQLLARMGLKSKREILNFFSHGYIRRGKGNQYFSKSRRVYFEEMSIYPTRAEFLEIFSERELSRFIDEKAVLLLEIEGKEHIVPRARLVSLTDERLFQEVLEDWDNQLDFIFKRIVSDFTVNKINSIELAMFFFFILNCYFDIPFNLNTASDDEDVFLKAIFYAFASEIDQLFEMGGNFIDQTLKATFRGYQHSLSIKTGGSIEAIGNYHYKMKYPLPEIAIKRVNEIIQPKKSEFEQLITRYFWNFLQQAGLCAVYGINTIYDPLKVAEALFGFGLKLGAKPEREFVMFMGKVMKRPKDDLFFH